MLPDDVKKAAEVLEGWARKESSAMRAAGFYGPAVMLLELVASVCNYFLVAMGVRPRC